MLGFVHIRIDDRLIHGQVATRWAAEYKVNRIMVIDDTVASDEIQKNILRMAAPVGVNTSILPFEKAVANIKNGNYVGQRVMLIVKDPSVLVAMLENGVDLLDINIGNLSNREGAKQYKKSISLLPEEEKAIRTLLEKRMNVTARMVPDEPLVSITNFIGE
ncbi:MAG: PTS sugar transporter subunit IIB [Lactobacillales bacterium]|jgi:PTS system mannose-specific IIB component|nr:PTS sugar transporter subunit IIB [Lactobacillales bacterium]